MKRPPKPVADGGWGWVVLLATFSGLLLMAGSVTNLGVYMVEWQEYFSVGAASVSVIATEMTCGLHFAGLLSGALCKSFGCRPVMMVGGFMAAAGTFMASFATELWHLYIAFAIAGIGNGLCYIPCVVVIRFYFNKRLGFANGVTYAGVGAGLLILAPVMERICSTYGWKGALMIHSAINANNIVCGVVYRRSKLESQMLEQCKLSNNTIDCATANSKKSHRYFDNLAGKNTEILSLCHNLFHRLNNMFSLSKLFKAPRYVMFNIVVLFSAYGYFSTLVFVTPKLVYDLGFSKMMASWVMSVFGMTSVATRIVNGFLLDYKVMSLTNMYLLALFISGIYPLINPLVTSHIAQFFLIAAFGISTGIMNSTMTLVCRQYIDIDLASTGLGLLLTFAGVGVLIGTQLIGKLVDVTGSYDIPFVMNGVVMVGAAALMAFVTKCSRWKETPHVMPEEGTTNENVDREDEEVTRFPCSSSQELTEVTINLRESSHGPSSTSYHPVPTGNDQRNDQRGGELDSIAFAVVHQ